jgi:hypothetical protein
MFYNYVFKACLHSILTSASGLETILEILFSLAFYSSMQNTFNQCKIQKSSGF